MNRPGGLRDFRRAVRAYVVGHDRIWETDRKLGRDVTGVTEETPEPEWQGEPAPPRYGVGVARTLRFDRGPSIWRDRTAAATGAGRERGDDA